MIFASGTGTTAMFAARQFVLQQQQQQQHYASNLSDNNTNNNKNNNKNIMSLDIEVIAIPCVSTKEHLYRDMQLLDQLSGNVGIFPSILDDSGLFKYPFVSCKPPICISPITPTGTRFKFLSNIYTFMLCMGTPIE